MFVLTFFVILGYFIYLKILKPNQYWKEKGIRYLEPWPIVGNMGPNVFKRQALGDLVVDMFKAFPGQRYMGIYHFSQPTLLVRDLELIKTITLKEFDTFPDHRQINSGDADPLQSHNLFNLTDAHGWRDMRSKLSPAFTSSKMQSMYVLMEKCADQFIEHFQKQKSTASIDVKDAFSRFTNDVIGTTAFGVTCDSLEDPENDFYTMGKNLTDYSGVKGLKYFATSFSPTLTKLFKITLCSKEVNDFLGNLVKKTIRIREDNQIVRHDMIHLMMEARKGRLKHESQSTVVDSGFAVVQESEIERTQSKPKPEFTDDDITAQALVFFFAGFETTSTIMSLTAYELAVNPNIQAKLHQEIIKHCKSGISYEVLLGMNYLDCVISEALRKWPSVQSINRQSAKPFTIKPKLPGEKPLHLEAGSAIWMPIFAIHRDPDNYPEPDKFDPERFNEANRHNIKPFSYLPFGSGPRNCIGSRFSLLETKLIIVRVLQKFQIVPVEKTQIPFKMGTSIFNHIPNTGLWLGLKSRQDLN